jgi:hypothetical protein
LARNEVFEKKGTKFQVTKIQSLTKTKAFIQNIHHFRDDSLQSKKPPIERVVIFDEAQRAWTEAQTSLFRAQKKGIADFSMSEPEFLISVLDRHQDWAVIICLIGGGQEINTGEAGLSEWFSSIQFSFPHWDVYMSNKLTDEEYTNGENIYSGFTKKQLKVKSGLHLSVSLRSFRSEKLASFVKAYLDLKPHEANVLHDQFKDVYPIAVTRNIYVAKEWLKSKARGGESFGLTCSSGAYRLKLYGIHVKSQIDWTCIAWDANLRKEKDCWEYKNFRGTEWQNIKSEVRRKYLLNAYRVLLTRARQGMIIFVPEGDNTDRTRLSEFYDPVYEYLIECGIQCV